MQASAAMRARRAAVPAAPGIDPVRGCAPGGSPLAGESQFDVATATMADRGSPASGLPQESAVRAAQLGIVGKPACRRGFTLLEVLVALLLLSLALVALVRTTALEARALAQLQEGTVAQWVAANALAELRLAEQPATIGERDGRAEMAGRRWRWRMQIAATEAPRLLRVEVEVRPEAADGRDDGLPVAQLTGFVER
jgi:general secretion pathway protein I